MDFNIIAQSTKSLGRVLTKNSPTIFTALGVAGLIGTVVLAVKATPKAMEILDYETEFRLNQWENQTGEHRDSYPLDRIVEPIEAIELTWKCYIPATLMGLTTIGCIVASNSINQRRNAALASLFTLAEATLNEYKEKVVETIGENKERKIEEEIVQDKLTASPVDDKAVIITGKGNYLCFDSFSGRYFQSDIDTLQKAENKFNQKLLREGWLAINEFYYEIGLENIELGDEMGWIAERSMLELKFTTKMAKENVPCAVIEYRVTPIHI